METAKPKKTHTAGRRHRESKVVLLVAELLQRGARTKTVHALTGMQEIVIRDIYREVMGKSPTKGPSGYCHTNFVSDQKTQLNSTVAWRCLQMAMESRASTLTPVAPELGHLYVTAYDNYLTMINGLGPICPPLTFEKFASLAQLMSRKTLLGERTCRRCGVSFVVDRESTDLTAQKHCPICRIMGGRGCAKCGVYVPISPHDVTPRRKPVCLAHVSPPKEAGGYSRPGYANNESQTAPAQQELVAAA